MEQLLTLLKNRIETDNYIFKDVNSGEAFEDYVFNQMKSLQVELKIKSVKHNGVHSFPDFRIEFEDGTIFGLEIKFSSSGNWYSKGNSVFETHSNKEEEDNLSYKEIYILFGRKPKAKEDNANCEVKFSTYSASIKKIEVTHSPRFAISMNESHPDLFTALKSTDTYLKFRVKSVSEKNEFIKKYFNKFTKGDHQDKWYINKGEEIQLKPVNFKKLNKSEKSRILAESFILYPHDLFQTIADYSEVGANMITRHFVYSTSLRDSFSAGGKMKILPNDPTEYPKILNTFIKHQNFIKQVLNNPEEDLEELCFNTWKAVFRESIAIKIDKTKSLEENFKNIILNLKPTMEVKKQNKKTKKVIDLSLFLTF
ncbi:hypothetical protein [Bacillus velezensis]